MKRIILTLTGALFSCIIFAQSPIENQVEADNNQNTIYTNDMDYVVGDVKQAFIQNKITTHEKADNLIKGLKNLGVNAIRVPIFAEGLDPNKPMFDYFYNLAVNEGFPIFANPAQHSGGQRVANGVLAEVGESVKNDPAKTTALINRIKDFAVEYPCKWINPFNEDGAPGGAWSASQMNTIYSSLKNNLNGAELIGPCAWGIPASNRVLKETNVADYITVAGTHNLGFNHADLAEFIALSKAKGIPVWDSEVNHNDKYNTGTRLEVAIAAKVDGLVMYNIWNTINLTNGAINNAGRKLMSIYLKNVPEITPQFQINGGEWIEENIAIASPGSTLKLAPLPEDGTWTWSGPNDFIAATREISIENLTAADAGNYIASYTSPEGYVNHFIMTVGLAGTSSPTITPYYRIDNNSWVRGTNVYLDEGSTVKFGPNSSSSGTWIWSGPNDFTSTAREITISDIMISQQGEYKVTRLTSDGYATTLRFNLTVNDIEVPFPNPDTRYYIDCPALGVRLGANGGEDAFTTSTSVTDYNVQWTVKESSTEGFYHIDCIGGIAAPRIRTDRTAFADMQSTSSTGSYTKWSFTPTSNNSFYLTTQDLFLPRLQINSAGEVRMVASSINDNTTQFTFTDVKKGLVETDVTSINPLDATSELIFPGLLNSPDMQLKPIHSIDHLTNYTLEVYTIQGNRIFISTDVNSGWNPMGYSNGVYIYKASYRGDDNQTKTISGKVCCAIF